MFWDEQDRMRAFYNDNTGTFQYYNYDDKGERAIKYGLDAPAQLYQNGAPVVADDVRMFEYKLYPNPYVTVSSTGQYTKHYFEGSKRFASRLMDGAVRFEDPSVLYTTKTAQDQGREKKADTEADFKKYLEKTGLGSDVSVELREAYQRPNLYYLHGDHLGTATFVTNSQGDVTQFFLNLPFGETMLEQMDGSYNNPYKFNAKELDDDTGLYYYGARYYNPRLSIWYGVDPLAEKYPGWTPYNYTADNPINYVDPDGREIIGVTKKDAQNFKDDIHRVLADKKFDQMRSLINIKGKTFVKVDPDNLSAALKGIELSADEQTYIDMVTNTINSSAKHKIEYISGDFASSEGSSAFKDYMNTVQEGVGDKMVNSDGLLSAGIVKAYGDGYNVPTKDGSHSFIGAGVEGNERSVTSSHEVFGHGIPSSKKLSPASNNANAIRTDNLTRRLLNMPERDGSNHGGYNAGHIIEPNKLPMTK